MRINIGRILIMQNGVRNQADIIPEREPEEVPEGIGEVDRDPEGEGGTTADPVPEESIFIPI
jgi:hypothetical protein